MREGSRWNVKCSVLGFRESFNEELMKLEWALEEKNE
jgi:hypothetical protein